MPKRAPPVRLTILFGCATILGLLFAAQAYIDRAYMGLHIDWREALVPALENWYGWLLFAPLIFRLYAKAPLTPSWEPRFLLIHVPASLALAAAKLFVDTIALWLLGQGSPTMVTPMRALANFLTYWAIVGISYALAEHHEEQELRLRRSQLETDLAQSQLQLLKMQIQPHFLFNTLNTISAIMRTDVATADRMITILSELFRAILHSSSAQEVPLRQELQFVQSYLEIEKIRYQGRLSVLVDVEPATLGAAVPSLLLQPLVENAIRHGIAPRSTPGQIEIRSRREGADLHLTIRDNGVGLPGGAAEEVEEGVGLGNTRARLEQLYGGRSRLDLWNAPEGGAAVNIAMPFRVIEY